MNTIEKVEKKQVADFNKPPANSTLGKFPLHIYKLMKDSKTDLLYRKDVADKYNAFVEELIKQNDIIRDTYVLDKYKLVTTVDNLYIKYRKISFPHNYTDKYYRANEKERESYINQTHIINDKWVELYNAIYPSLSEYLNKMINEQEILKKEREIKTKIRYLAKKISNAYKEIEWHRAELDEIDPDKFFRTKYKDDIIKDYGVNL